MTRKEKKKRGREREKKREGRENELEKINIKFFAKSEISSFFPEFPFIPFNFLIKKKQRKERGIT